ncbi:MAG: hypothetical protein V7746_19640 [Halioglobus sp.]
MSKRRAFLPKLNLSRFEFSFIIVRALVIFLCLSPASLRAEDVVTLGSGGGVNWTQGFVWADGYGAAADSTPHNKKRLLARRAAQLDAYRNLSEFVNGVRVTSETVVKDLALESDTIRTSIDSLIRGAIMVEDHYQNEIAQVTMKIMFDGSFSRSVNTSAIDAAGTLSFGDIGIDIARLVQDGLASILPAAYAGEQTGELVQSSSDLEMAERLLQRAGQYEPTALLEQLQSDADRYREGSHFTGLLIDARGVPGFELATVPRLRDPEGKVLYPSEDMLRSTLSARRPVSYDFDLDDAIRNSRIAVNPHVVKALSVFKSRKSDLVLNSEDVKFITGNDQIMAVIRDAGVMILVSP